MLTMQRHLNEVEQMKQINVIGQGRKLSTLSRNLRNQAEKLNQLLSEIGSSYAGQDADAYRTAIVLLQNEMKSIAGEMDRLGSRLK